MRKPPRLHQNGYAVSRDLTPVLVCTEKLKPLGRETRRHPRRQVDKLAASLAEYGFAVPIVVDVDSRVVAGWGLVLAARQLGLPQVPAVTITDLDEAKLRLLRLALNRLGEDSSWDDESLRLEFSDILSLDTNIDLQISGFEMGEIDIRLRASPDDEEDEILRIDQRSPMITKPGDIWVLDQHRIVCGDALQAENYSRLLGDERAQMVFTDSPWNVPIEGHVSGLGAVKHAEFAMASGEMSSAEFQTFLATTLGHAARHAVDGSIHFLVIDWRHIKELLDATADLYTEMKNLCIWNKSNAGMGSLYRSKHELVFVFKKGKAPHINNIELGRFGRNRTNVWDYPSQNTLTNSAKGKLSLHPTCKPVGLVADAMRDCSNLNDIVLTFTPKPACPSERRKFLGLQIVKPASASTPAQLRGWIMTAEHSDDNEKVGKCKPPAHSRWKPGQCGNPRGRPKGALNFKTEVKLIMEAPMVVNIKGKPKRVTTLRAMLFRLLEMGLKGNVRCMDLFLKHAAWAYGGLAIEPPGDISKDDQAILDAYREEIRAETTKDDTGSRSDDSEDPK